MILTINNLKKFINSVKEKKINYIKIKHNEYNIVINKQKKYNYENSQLNYITSQTLDNSYNSKAHSENFTKKNLLKDNKNIETKKIKNNESQSYSTIISPMVGTFYRSPAPNEPAFIEKKDFVQKKQTVCIIEAMKLMNEIESEVNGEIIEILVNDGDIVDCGQALIKIKIS
uniref:Biotin carboxyl carrier protein of acetyl-CoA carboxylase n=1 Tax=Dasya naccarioides TaxID=2007180 RepID=A0A1Z1MH36_9FLOR|nr:acetyl-CoA carboxylase biotin carboxyl carrier protein [Dasya naccarioides]ARW65209.1 acetyl-CoA carboxylase biotin carboxyl carrier protein [Dasya naccarioides]